MTSPYERPDRIPLAELERMLGALEEELTGIRRGGKVEPEGSRGGGTGRGGSGLDAPQARQRIALLEGENQLLRQRIAAAREQVERLRTRLRFIEDRGAGDAA